METQAELPTITVNGKVYILRDWVKEECREHLIIDDISGCNCGYPEHRNLCPTCRKQVGLE